MLRVDEKGLIPSEVRSMLNIKGAVRVEGEGLIIEPVRDPLDFLTSSVAQCRETD